MYAVYAVYAVYADVAFSPQVAAKLVRGKRVDLGGRNGAGQNGAGEKGEEEGGGRRWRKKVLQV